MEYLKFQNIYKHYSSVYEPNPMAVTNILLLKLCFLYKRLLSKLFFESYKSINIYF